MVRQGTLRVGRRAARADPGAVPPLAAAAQTRRTGTESRGPRGGVKKVEGIFCWFLVHLVLSLQFFDVLLVFFFFRWFFQTMDDFVDGLFLRIFDTRQHNQKAWRLQLGNFFFSPPRTAATFNFLSSLHPHIQHHLQLIHIISYIFVFHLSSSFILTAFDQYSAEIMASRMSMREILMIMIFISFFRLLSFHLPSTQKSFLCSSQDKAMRRRVVDLISQGLSGLGGVSPTSPKSPVAPMPSPAQLPNNLVAAEVENLLWGRYGKAKAHDYRHHARMLRTNLSHPQNSELRARVLSGDLKPEDQLDRKFIRRAGMQTWCNMMQLNALKSWQNNFFDYFFGLSSFWPGVDLHGFECLGT